MIEHLAGQAPAVFFDGFRIEALMPGSQYGVLYTFDATLVRARVLLALLAGLCLGWLARWLLSRSLIVKFATQAGGAWVRFWRLQAKFLVTIALINLITAAIVFVSLSRLQTASQTQKIERESVLFSQFSTAQVISNFTGFFYSYYNDRFIPETKKIIASNENLVGIRILSHRTGGVLFDSEQAEAAPGLAGLESTKSGLPPEIVEQLKARDLAVMTFKRGGEPFLEVVNTYRSENQEPVFWVEYVFGFQSLSQSIHAIRRQIWLDLIPSMALGLLIAFVFARFLIAPIRSSWVRSGG